MKRVIALVSCVLLSLFGCSKADNCLSELNDNAMVKLNGVEQSTLCSIQQELNQFVNERLHDPTSYESVSFGDFFVTPDGYQLKHTFRAATSAGGTSTQTYQFLFNRQTQLIDYKQSEFILAANPANK